MVLSVNLHSFLSLFCVKIIVTGMHWTGSPNRNIDHLGKRMSQKCQKFASTVAVDNFRTTLGYFWGRPHLVGTFYPKISFFPSFIVKNGQNKNPQIRGCFSCFLFFLFFLLSAFFCLSFSSLPLLFDILKPKKAPTRWGLWLFFRTFLRHSVTILVFSEDCPTVCPLQC